MTKVQILQGGAVGDTLTVANSGLAGSDAFSSVTIGSGHTLKYVADAAFPGGAPPNSSATAPEVTFTEYNAQNAATFALDGHFAFLVTAPSQLPQVFQARTASANIIRLAANSSGQLLVQVGSTGTNRVHVGRSRRRNSVRVGGGGLLCLGHGRVVCVPSVLDQWRD